MPNTFSFNGSSFENATYLDTTLLTPGNGTGVDFPTLPQAIAAGQTIGADSEVDLIAVTLVAGRSYFFDIDDGYDDPTGGSIDLEIDLIDSRGNLVSTNDDGGEQELRTDRGSFSGYDSFLVVQPVTTGVYYLAVHHEASDYNDGEFSFRSSTGTGDYNLIVGVSSLPKHTFLTSAADGRSFGAGAQFVSALDGADQVSLGGGNDIAYGDRGNDRLLGGSGDDELSGGSGQDRLYGQDGNDVLRGGAAHDQLSGGDGRDVLYGGARADEMNGGRGNDILWGGAGNDVLVGGSGNDFIRGGAGEDELRGGAGADTFHFLAGDSPYAPSGFDGEDRIDNFETVDRIDLSDLYSGTLAFVGTSAFSGDYQVRINDVRVGFGFQEVQVRLNGSVEIGIRVATDGTFDLTSTHFVL